MININEIKEIKARDCKNWQFEDRSGFEYGDVYSLGLDIKANGQIEPVVARPSHDKEFKYEIVAGSRRWKACFEMDIPLLARILPLKNEEAAFYQIKENEKHPLSDYSKGIHFDKVIKANVATIEKLAQMQKCSKNKIYNFLTFAKIPTKIWDAVIDMSKVSARSAMAIYTLANKGEEYIEALIDIAEEIRQGAGVRKIESLVLKAIFGDNAELDHLKKIETPDGKVLGHWSKNGIVFDKSIKIDQIKVEQVLIEALAS